MLAGTALISFVVLQLACATPLAMRDGGPLQKSIPASCSLTSMSPRGPLGTVPGSKSGTFDNVNTNPDHDFAPTAAFLRAQRSYSYFAKGDQTADRDDSADIKRCLELCHGFGPHCGGVAWAHNIRVQKFGVSEVGAGCHFLKTAAGPRDLEPVHNGSWTRAVVINIAC